jgi:DNA repair exonuclease SbcCD ATPase subunit
MDDDAVSFLLGHVIGAAYDRHVSVSGSGARGMQLRYVRNITKRALDQLRKAYPTKRADEDRIERIKQVESALENHVEHLDEALKDLHEHQPEPIEDEDYKDLKESIRTYLEEDPSDEVHRARFELQTLSRQLTEAAEICETEQRERGFLASAAAAEDRAIDLRQQYLTDEVENDGTDN